jgi:FMN phosphatase YigB (HAD superfamily)
MFCLRSGLKVEWIDMDLPDNTAGWRSEWYYITNQQSVLPKRTGHKPEKLPERDLQLTSRELDDVKELLPLVRDLKKKGLIGDSVARSFYRRLI